MKKLSSLLLVCVMLLALAAYGGGATNETSTADTSASETPASRTPAAEAPAEPGEPVTAPDPSASVTQLYYNSDVTEPEDAWTLAQVYVDGETFDVAVDAAAFTITFSLDPSELVDQVAYTHNRAYSLVGNLTFGVTAINDVLSVDGLDGHRGPTSWSDLPQSQAMMEGELYQQPSPATIRFQDADAYGLFLNQLAAGVPVDVDTTERNLILGLSNQDQPLLGANEKHLEHLGEEGGWAYCLIFDRAA